MRQENSSKNGCWRKDKKGNSKPAGKFNNNGPIFNFDEKEVKKPNNALHLPLFLYAP